MAVFVQNIVRKSKKQGCPPSFQAVDKSQFCYGDIPRDIPRRGVSQNLNSGVSQNLNSGVSQNLNSGVSPYIIRLNHGPSDYLAA